MPSGEVRTSALVSSLLQSQKNIFIPKITGTESADMVMPQLHSEDELNSMKHSKWGIPEFSIEDLSTRKDGLDEMADVVIAPGVSFTIKGDRLGHGKGYYDCFLAKLLQRRYDADLPPPFIVGLAFDEQIFEDVPKTEHDVTLNAVACPSELYMTNKN